MTDNKKIPTINTFEELLVIRTVLDQIDVFNELAEEYKIYSKYLLYLMIVI